MTVVDDAIAAELLLLEPVRQPPPDPNDLGFGSDLDCVNDLTPRVDELDPDSRLGLAQAIYHSLATRRGMLLEDPDYGIDLISYLHKPLEPVDIVQMEGEIANQVRKDDRVADVELTVTVRPDFKTFTVKVRVVPADPELENFSLTLIVTDGATLLEAITG